MVQHRVGITLARAEIYVNLTSFFIAEVFLLLRCFAVNPKFILEFVYYSSCCPESQREAALLLGQFASTDSDCKVQFHLRFSILSSSIPQSLISFFCLVIRSDKLFVAVDL